MYEIEIPIIIEKNLVAYEYGFFTRGYHVYMDIWNSLIGEILKCKREPTNEVDKHDIPFTSIEVEVVGKRLNRDHFYDKKILSNG